MGIAARALAAMMLVVGAFGNASGRILPGWMSERLGRINVLRVMIGISMVAMPALCAAVSVVCWCYGMQLPVTGVAASEFWGTRNAGVNYGLPYAAWGVAGIIGPRIGGVLSDRHHNHQAAFFTAATLAGAALLCELGAEARTHRGTEGAKQRPRSTVVLPGSTRLHDSCPNSWESRVVRSFLDEAGVLRMVSRS